jgi:hypothetical protein
MILKQEPNVRPRSFAGKPFRGSAQLSAAQEIFKGTLWGSMGLSVAHECHEIKFVEVECI